MHASGVVNFTIRPLYLQRNSSRYSVNWRLRWNQGRSGKLGEEKNTLPWPDSALNKLQIATAPLCHAIGPEIMWLLLVRFHTIFKMKWYRSKSPASSKICPLYEFQLTESVFLSPLHHFLKNQEGHLDNQLWGESTCCICEIWPSGYFQDVRELIRLSPEQQICVKGQNVLHKST